MRSWGETLARLVDRRINAPVANTAAITAITAAYRCDGMQILETTNGTTWWFDADSTAPAGPSVLVPDAGSGRWLSTAGGAGGPSTKIVFVRGCPTGALAAYTRAGNVITANAVGALGAQDGVTYVAGERLLLNTGAAGADNGPYQVTDPGGATAFVLTRIGEADASAEVVSGMFVHSSEGTANGNEWFTLSTADPIVLNTTALTFTQVPSFVDLASTAASQGASLLGVQDAAGRITGTTGETALAELAGRLFGAVADNAGVTAITAAQRVDGMIVIKLDDMTLWTYDLGSAAAASNWVLAPDAGAGRWLRRDAEPGLLLPPVANDAALVALTAAMRVDGSMVVKLDDMTVWAYDLGSAAAASDWVQVPTDTVGRWLRKDAPAGLVLPPVADNAALIALTAVDRVDGSLVVQLDTMDLWAYDLGSVAGASDWVIVPTDGVGRWIKVDAEAGLVLPTVADNAALIALTAVDRIDGSIVVQLDTMTLWTYDLGSVAGASDWVIVPTDGVGRWHRYYTTLADLAATTAGHGGELVGLYDPTNVVTATTVGTGVVEAAVNIDTIRPGKPMTNRLRMLGAPGAIVEGDTVTIGANVFEFRASTPPAGGTAGRIWVYQGADSAASRANFIDAVNGVIDANRITYDGALTETFLAAAGVTLGDVFIVSAALAGGAPVQSATATVTTEVLTTVTDIWDAGTCYGGRLQVAVPVEIVTITLTADHIAKGNVQFQFMTVPAAYTVFNRMRVQNEATAVVGNAVSLTLAGGATPNNQAADVVDCILFA